MDQKTQSPYQRLAYIRVSTVLQNTDRQLADILHTCHEVFEDKLSGKSTDRPQLAAMLKHARKGDTIVVHSMDRLARSLDDLKRMVNDLTGRGITIEFRKEGLSFGPEHSSSMSKLLLHIMGAFAEFERELLLERQREGIAEAKKKGVYKGRAPLAPAVVAEIRCRAEAREPKASIAKTLGISRQTVYVYLNQLKETPLTPPA